MRKGLTTIRRLETWTAPFKILICVALVWWALDRAGGAGPIFAAPSAFVEGGARAGQFWIVFWPALTAMIGYWATLALNIPDFTRFARSQKDQVVGQALGLPPMMGLIALASVITTSATVVIYGRAIWDPVELAGTLAGPFVLLGLVVISIDTVSCNIAANLVSSAYDFSSLWPKRISYRTGGMITAAIGVLIMPWKLLETTGGYIFVWLAGYSALLGPIAGILIADYWLIRRTRLDVDALYEAAGVYSYRKRLEPGRRHRLRRGRAAQPPGLPQDRRPGRVRLDRPGVGGRLCLCLVHRPRHCAARLRGADARHPRRGTKRVTVTLFYGVLLDLVRDPPGRPVLVETGPRADELLGAAHRLRHAAIAIAEIVGDPGEDALVRKGKPGPEARHRLVPVGRGLEIAAMIGLHA